MSAPLETLARSLPPGRVVVDPAALAEYAQDITENPPAMPAAVVQPTSTSEIPATLRWAADHGVPVTPCVARTNVGGLTIPSPGGIVLDLRDLRGILAVDPDEMYALIEPGVTFGQLREHLDRHHPGLEFGYPLAPPYASVLANCLLDGLSNLSLRHGSMDEWVNGLEAVLPDGEVVRTGSAALSPSWFARVPLPDLTGLFLGWQGTTGVVTRMAVRLWPASPHHRRFFLLVSSAEMAFPLARRLARTGLLDDLAVMSWPVGRWMHQVYAGLERAEGEPEYLLYAHLSAATPRLMAAKEEVVRDAVADLRRADHAAAGPLGVDDLIRLNPALERFARFPMTLDFLLEHPGGGLTWVGTYGPASRWVEGAQRGSALLEQHGFPPAVLTRAMRDGHFGVLRFPILFDRSDADAVAHVRTVNTALLDLTLDLGFVMYKAPAWAAERMRARMDAGYLALLQRLHALLDPAGVLNPNKGFR